uniref:MSTP032 n=1 Tax=Homo sapiens TaxID=9606 RepID=Q9H3F2_HUMAN|nr:MSTP032 [Homo sapiens]AAQ13619.1 MSTP106 [Homo sapiens]AAQ13663.1 MSTP129 [Homo sapiens]
MYGNILCPTLHTLCTQILYCMNYALSRIQCQGELGEINYFNFFFILYKAMDFIWLMCALYTSHFNRMELLIIFQRVIDMQKFQ